MDHSYECGDARNKMVLALEKGHLSTLTATMSLEVSYMLQEIINTPALIHAVSQHFNRNVAHATRECIHKNIKFVDLLKKQIIHELGDRVVICEGVVHESTLGHIFVNCPEIKEDMRLYLEEAQLKMSNILSEKSTALLTSGGDYAVGEKKHQIVAWLNCWCAMVNTTALLFAPA